MGVHMSPDLRAKQAPAEKKEEGGLEWWWCSGQHHLTSPTTSPPSKASERPASTPPPGGPPHPLLTKSPPPPPPPRPDTGQEEGMPGVPPSVTGPLLALGAAVLLSVAIKETLDRQQGKQSPRIQLHDPKAFRFEFPTNAKPK